MNITKDGDEMVIRMSTADFTAFAMAAGFVAASEQVQEKSPEIVSFSRRFYMAAEKYERAKAQQAEQNAFEQQYWKET